MSQDELSLDEIEGILAQPDPKPRTGGGRRKKADIRDIQSWMKAQHNIRENCTVPTHEEVTDRPRNKGVVVEIGDYYVCRMCFLAEADKNV